MYNHSIQHEKPSTKYYGMYRGLVVDNLDPKHAGRIKVRVYGVFDDLAVDLIPWAEYADPMMGGQAGFGGFFVPDVQSHVWVFFEAGDHMQPVYFAGAPAHSHMPPERSESEYPFNRVLKTKAGHIVEFDDSPDAERIRIFHKSGTMFVMYANGDMDEYVVGNVNRVVMGDVEETVVGDYTKSVGGNLEELISGNHETSIVGSRKEQSGDGSEYLSGGVIDINGTRINLN